MIDRVSMTFLFEVQRIFSVSLFLNEMIQLLSSFVGQLLPFEGRGRVEKEGKKIPHMKLTKEQSGSYRY